MAYQEIDDVDKFIKGWESFSLTEEEANNPVWKQIFDEQVIDKRFVQVTNKTETVENDDLSQFTFQTDFSDEETDSGQLKNKDQLPSDVCSLNLLSYQLELAKKPLLGLNSVICAPTGSGKTRIATHIILEHLKQTGPKKKRVIFLATTVPLAAQQYKALKKFLPSENKITILTGQSKNSMSLEFFLDFNDIFVMTPMILVNNIKSSHMHLDLFSLIVFDECHHTRKDEPYNTLMSLYFKDKAEGFQMPQIIGLTATIGIEESSTLETAKEVILKVLGNLDTPYLVTVQENIKELNEKVPKSVEKYKELQQRAPNATYQTIIEIMVKLEQKLKECTQNLNSDTIKQIMEEKPDDKTTQAYGQWAVNVKGAVHSIPENNLGKDDHMFIHMSVIALEYLLKYNAALETYNLVESIDILNYLENNFRKFSWQMDRTDSEKQFYKYFEDLKELILINEEEKNSNLEILKKVLVKNLIKKDLNSRGIIFVKTRALAELVKSWLLRSNNSELEALNAEIFTGANVSEDQGGMTQMKQEEIKNKFKNGDIQVLVATSVAEEGLDIPQCNLVVKYNHVGNEVTTVQTKGRSRQFGGVSYLLGTADVRDREKKNHEKSVIMGKAIELVSKENIEYVKERILQYQQDVLQSLALEEQMTIKQDKCFKVVCRNCRQVKIDSCNMRTIYGKYRVSIDRELLNKKFIKCKAQRPECMGELEFLGPIICQGHLPSGKYCRSPLGQMIKHKKVPFFNVGIKYVGISVDDNQPLMLLRQWKKLDINIDELTFDDLKNYIEAM